LTTSIPGCRSHFFKADRKKNTEEREEHDVKPRRV